MTVGELVGAFANAWGPEAKWLVRSDSPDLRETNQLRLETSLARTVLGWSSCISVYESLRLAADWYRAFYQKDDRQKLLDITLNQLRQHGETFRKKN